MLFSNYYSFSSESETAGALEDALTRIDEGAAETVVPVKEVLFSFFPVIKPVITGYHHLAMSGISQHEAKDRIQEV